MIETARTSRGAVLGAALLLMACNDVSGPREGETRLTYDFATSTLGWTANFADYPVGGEEAYELQSGHGALPVPLDTSKKGLYLSGNNHSDDLLMYVQRRVDGLEPGARYRVRYEVQLATDAPKGCVGVGGAAGESVYVKAGAAPTEPARVADTGAHWRLNVDIGNQAAEGRYAMTIGDVATTNTDCTTPVYELKTLTSEPKVLELQADGSGSVWLIVGTDSGFESTTKIWLTRIDVRLMRVGS